MVIVIIFYNYILLYNKGTIEAVVAKEPKGVFVTAVVGSIPTPRNKLLYI